MVQYNVDILDDNAIVMGRAYGAQLSIPDTWLNTHGFARRYIEITNDTSLSCGPHRDRTDVPHGSPVYIEILSIHMELDILDIVIRTWQTRYVPICAWWNLSVHYDSHHPPCIEIKNKESDASCRNRRFPQQHTRERRDTKGAHRWTISHPYARRSHE